MNIHSRGNCFHCGADDGLHQYETMKCPRFGREAHVGTIQEWDEKTFVNADYQRLCDAAPELLAALKTMLVATDCCAELPEGHPGHEAFLNIVAKPRAEQAITKAEGNQ